MRFSFDWASFYWAVYGGVFTVFGFAVGFVYWLGSGRSCESAKVGLGLFFSVFLLFLGGLTDVFWFVFWDGGGLPSAEVAWWWMPWFRIFGFWNSYAQLGLLAVAFLVVCVFWFFILR
ncbi:hypothetical protein KEJ45_03145 [Candidatus Bathyarchaeota archaeon]|nr:hypothetical protein [Candidatus Bathyarchaeota archaeon]